MILRRVTKHVKDQNWFAVGIDFFIVVVGVFVGLQVQNWSERQGDRSAEQRYLIELRQDLEMALNEIDETIANAELRRAAGAYVFDGAPPPNAVSTFKKMQRNFLGEDAAGAAPEDYLPLIFSVARIVDKHGDTYAELVATGNIGVFEDRSIARELSTYYSRYDEIQTGDEMNWTQMTKTREILQNRGISMTSPISPTNFITRVRDDDEIEAALQNVAGLAGWQVKRLSNLRDETEGTLARIESYSD
ncbi:MAG: hypothetical protein NXH70_08120 [Hyphomonas sp.]|nr:hypothetical protein [Hyphomonas sp.]